MANDLKDCSLFAVVTINFVVERGKKKRTHTNSREFHGNLMHSHWHKQTIHINELSANTSTLAQNRPRFTNAIEITIHLSVELEAAEKTLSKKNICVSFFFSFFLYDTKRYFYEWRAHFHKRKKQDIKKKKKNFKKYNYVQTEKKNSTSNQQAKSLILRTKSGAASFHFDLVKRIFIWYIYVFCWSIASANGNGEADRIINNENYRCSKYIR